MLEHVRRQVSRWAAERPTVAAPDLERVICFDVTHGAIDGCCYLIGDRTGFPRLVAKAARTAAGQAVLEIEHANLGMLERIGMNAGRRTTPEALGSWRVGRDLITLQSALEGSLLKNVPGRRLFAPATAEATVRRVVDWWSDLVQRYGVEPRTLDNEGYEQEVLSHVRRFAGRYRLADAERDLLELRFERERALEGLELPFMVRHGDFCTANMVLAGADGLGVFDWEFPLRHETPLFDLFYFFASTRFPYSGSRGETDHFASFVEVLWGENHLGRLLARTVAETCQRFGLPGAAAGDLLLLSCVQLANLKYKGFVASRGETPEEGPLDEDAKQHRWRSFPDMNLPFGCIRGGRLLNLGVFVERGFPWWCNGDGAGGR